MRLFWILNFRFGNYLNQPSYSYYSCLSKIQNLKPKIVQVDRLE